MKNNYHTHTYRCGHAKGTEEEMVLGAIKNGFTTLGMSDHIPLPNFRFHLLKGVPLLTSIQNAGKHFKWFSQNGLGTRMPYKQKQVHLSTMRELKEKYKDQITIHIGFEAEYFPEYLAYYQELLDTNEVDYLLFGNHFYDICCDRRYHGFALDDQGILNYGKTSCLGMDTGLFSYFCHPDLFMAQTPVFSEACYKITRDICMSALKNNVPLELNGGGFRRGIQKIGNETRYPYPHDEFWKIVGELQVPVIIGLDSHGPDEFTQEECNTMEEYAKKFHLNIIDTLEFKKGVSM